MDEDARQRTLDSSVWATDEKGLNPDAKPKTEHAVEETRKAEEKLQRPKSGTLGRA